MKSTGRRVHLSTNCDHVLDRTPKAICSVEDAVSALHRLGGVRMHYHQLIAMSARSLRLLEAVDKVQHNRDGVE